MGSNPASRAKFNDFQVRNALEILPRLRGDPSLRDQLSAVQHLASRLTTRKSVVLPSIRV